MILENAGVAREEGDGVTKKNGAEGGRTRNNLSGWQDSDSLDSGKLSPVISTVKKFHTFL